MHVHIPVLASAICGWLVVAGIAVGASPTITALAPIPVSTPTGEKPQSKVWFHAGTWWAALPTGSESPGTYIWRLDAANGSWTRGLKISDRTDTHADVKLVGPVAHILLHGKAPELVSIQHDAARQVWEPWVDRPEATRVTVGETGTIDVDSRGRMWLATDWKTSIQVHYADPPYASFSSPVTLADNIARDDICVVTALPNNRIGVLWSNQKTRRFGFRVHRDADAPQDWSDDEIPAARSALDAGDGMADDHLNVKVATDGTLYAAVKTSYDNGKDPKIALLVRRPNGVWDDLYGVDTVGTRGIVLLDEQRGLVRVIYTITEAGGNIVFKESPISAIDLTGPSRPLIRGRLNNATSVKTNSDGRTVVLAADKANAWGVLVVDGDPTLAH